MNLMKKNLIFRKIKIIIPAGVSTSGAPLGPMLAQFAVNTIAFCKEFNDKTNVFINENNNMKINLVVNLTIFEDKSFVFDIKKPNISFLIKSIVKYKYFVILEDIVKIIIFFYGPVLDFKKFKLYCKSLIGTLSSMNFFLIKEIKNS